MKSLFTKCPWNKPHILPWIILFFAATNIIFIGGKRRAFGSFVAEFRKEFGNVTLSELNWIGDSYAAVGYLCSSLSTTAILYFNRRYGLFQFLGSVFVFGGCVASSFVPNPHWLFITHTVINGIGSSLVISIVGLVVNEYFDVDHPYHLIATTLVAGGPVASIVFVPTFAYLIQHYKWRIAFLILGILYFIIYGMAAAFYRRNDMISEEKDKIKFVCQCDGITMRQVPLLALWFIDRILTSVVTYGLILNLTDYVYRVTPNLVHSSTLTTLYSAGESSIYILGAIATAATKNFFKNKLRFVLVLSSIVGTIVLVAQEFIVSSTARKGLVFITGLSMGPSNMFLFPAGEELTRLPGDIAYPFSLGGMGVGMILSPLLTATLAEVFKYKWFFLAQGCLIFIKVVCILLITGLLFYYKIYAYESEYTELWEGSDIIEIEKQSSHEKNPLLPDREKKRS